MWTANANPPIVTAPDPVVEALYEQGDGYKPSQGGEGPGGNEQHLLTYILNKGAPAPSGSGRVKIAAFVEVDPRNTDDVKRTIADCGVAYIGFNVPSFMQSLEAPGSTWDVDPSGDNSSVGGHAVILVGYDAQAATVVSWGSLYRMTWAFFGQFVDEVYALADADWIAATGNSPGGLTLAQLEDQMQALKSQP